MRGVVSSVGIWSRVTNVLRHQLRKGLTASFCQMSLLMWYK